MKKTPVFVLTVLVLLALFCISSSAAGSPDKIPFIGGEQESEIWYSFSDGRLLIGGSGRLPDYSNETKDTVPWASFRDEITLIDVCEGITYVGDYLLSGCANLETCILRATVTEVGDYVFYGCPNLDRLYLCAESGVPTIGAGPLVKEYGSICVPAYYYAYESAERLAGYHRLGLMMLYPVVSGHGTVWALPGTVIADWLEVEIVPDDGYDVKEIRVGNTYNEETEINDGHDVYMDHYVKLLVTFDEHDWDETLWSVNPEGHWHPCKNQECSVSDHSTCCIDACAYAPHDTLGENGTCSVCGFIPLPDGCEWIDGEKSEVWWKITDGKLILGGRGATPDFSEEWTESPSGDWRPADDLFYSRKDEITEIEILPGVTAIGKNLFFALDKVEKVTLPDTLVSIGYSAFEQTESLHEIVFAEDSRLVTIDDYAFAGCESLKDLVLPEGIETLGRGSFTWSGVETIVIPASVISVEGDIFAYTPLNRIVFLGSVKTFGMDCFKNCDQLKTMILYGDYPDYPGLGENVIDGGKIYFPVKKLDFYTSHAGWSVHADKFGTIGKIKVDSNDSLLLETPEEGFAGQDTRFAMILPTDKDLQSLEVITDGGESVPFSQTDPEPGKICFFFTMPTDNVTVRAVFGSHTIDPVSFDCDEAGHWHLCTNEICLWDADPVDAHSSLSFAAHDTLGANGSCSVCGYLPKPEKSFWINDEHTIWGKLSATDTLTVGGRGSLPDYEPESAKPWGDTVVKVIVSGGIESIGAYAFDGQTDLTEVVCLGNSLREIGERAFSACPLLESVSLPDSVETIGEGAFLLDRELDRFDFPSSLVNIGDSAFCGVSLPSVILPESVRTIGGRAFSQNDSLSEVILPEGLISLGKGVFAQDDSLDVIELRAVTPPALEEQLGENGARDFKKIYVPALARPAYSTASNWEQYSSILAAAVPVTLLVTGEGTVDIPSVLSPSELCRFTIIPSSETGFCDVASLSVTDANGNPIEFDASFGHDISRATGSFRAGFSGVTVEVTFSEHDFDVNHWTFSDYGHWHPCKNQLCSLAESFFSFTGDPVNFGYHDSLGKYGSCSVCGFPRLPDGAAWLDENRRVWWMLTGGTLTVGGVGAAPDYPDPSLLPWTQSFFSVETIVVEDGITSIGDWLFSNLSSLRSVTLPASIESIGRHAFLGAESLLQITVASAIPPSVEDSTFIACNETFGICVPSSSVSAYRAADGWSDRADFVTAYIKFESMSILLDGRIGMNLFVTLSEAAKQEGGRLEFTVSGKDGETTSIPFEEALPDGKGRWKFTCYVNAVQMADEVTATYYGFGGVSFSQKISVQKYIDKIVGLYGENSTETVAVLVRAISDFGHYAQISLSEAHGWTIGTDHAAVTSYGTPDTSVSLISHAFTKEGESDGISGLGGSLILEEATDVVLYFTLDSSLHPAEPVIRVTDPNGKEVPYSLEEIGTGSFRIVIGNIPAHKLGDRYRITFDGSLTVTLSALSYAERVLSSESISLGEKNTAAALYAYYLAAMAFRGK